MKHEISQINIPEQQQLIPAVPRVSLSKEIGEAQVVHNIFGKARVRIVRKNDDTRRNLWISLLVLLLVIAAWLGWVASQQQEEEQPVVEPIPATGGREAAGDMQPAMPPAEPVVVKEQIPQPVVTIKPQTAPPESVRPPVPQAAKAPVSATPASPKPAASIRPVPSVAASSPSVATPLAAPTVTNDTSVHDAAVEKSPVEPTDTSVK